MDSELTKQQALNDDPAQPSGSASRVSALEARAVRQVPGTWGQIRIAFRSSWAAMLSLGFLVLVIALAIGAPMVERFDPHQTFLRAFEDPPSTTHWLGTDSAGRDVWSRLIWGSRTSLIVAGMAVAISVTIGTLVGAFSGFYGRWIDSVLMRVTDGFIAFPDIVLVLMLASILGPSISNVIFVIGFLSWTGVARLVRGQFFSLREQDWVMAARSVGVSNSRLIFRHLLPHVLSQVVIAATFGAAGATLTEAGLSYLGLGVRPPTPSWGSMLSEAQSVHVFQNVPWSWLAPGILLTMVVLALNYIGNTLRRGLDPRHRRR